MKLQRVRTRRQLLRATAVSAASIPFLAVTGKSASAENQNQNQNNNHSCFLKGTKISTPSGDCLVQDPRIGDEVQTLDGRKTIKWIGYNKFTKAEGRAWQDGVMPIRVARFAIDDQTYGAERQSKMTPPAPILKYRSRVRELSAVARSLVSEIVDVRDPIQIAYDQLAQRAEAMLV